MPPEDWNDVEKRVLLVAPTRRDADVTQSLLTQVGLTSVVCENVRRLNEELSTGAAALLLTEDVISGPDVDELLAALDRQPPWSDLPIVLLLRSGVQSPA